MLKSLFRVGILLSMLLLTVASAYAQDAETTEEPQAVVLPVSHTLTGVRFEAQMWNNCGPATITNALTYFGYVDDQRRAQSYLKPDMEDKNVTPWQMADFVNSQVNELSVYAMVRTGGTIDLLRSLIANNFPVIIEEGYDPPPHDLGWMGHYLLMIGYDDTARTFTTHDSYEGANYIYSYDHIAEYWQHFNYTYIVVYNTTRQTELAELLGDDLDEFANIAHSLEVARQEAVADNTDAFAWFNMGTNLVRMAEYARNGGDEATAQEWFRSAAIAYDQARNIGLPWRMLWYQFGPYEAYLAVERYEDVLALARAVLNDGGGQYVEESYYYGGLAREALGEYDRALSNYAAAIQFNPNFTPAVNARNALQQRIGNS